MFLNQKNNPSSGPAPKIFKIHPFFGTLFVDYKRKGEIIAIVPPYANILAHLEKATK